ncbi:DUF2325 domain-containing protein [Desulforamulus aquiferis]|uniref:DUF2325 domain-containing protein n=1 Tax=Desulforamulus aquiferis TaxID=1397668 RepID=A0AAW7ZA67_9FIRM|nr:DUF2325 domain-containing protein [Desulforamulus aquiferis]MDO7786318.1 DUF2325 domain-containing protein [Desulforamulus aquiferis]RYD06162.1 hypothetical protein N752_04545 [Desulforamulus aquiferis]
MLSANGQTRSYNYMISCHSQICPKINSADQNLNKQCNLCPKRILLVGGITKLKAVYKDIIEGSGGEFEYMDGYMKGGDKALDNKIKRCDMVLCPVDCNSHNACLSVKKLCKKHKKPFHMLKSSSISGISMAVSKIV